MTSTDIDRGPLQPKQPDICDCVRVLDTVTDDANIFFSQNEQLICRKLASIKNGDADIAQMRKCFDEHFQKLQRLTSVLTTFVNVNYVKLERIVLHSFPPHRIIIHRDITPKSSEYINNALHFCIDHRYQYSLTRSGNVTIEDLNSNHDQDVNRLSYIDTWTICKKAHEYLSDTKDSSGLADIVHCIRLVDAIIGYLSDRIYDFAKVIMQYSNNYRLGVIDSGPILTPRDSDVKTTDADLDPPEQEVPGMEDDISEK